MTDCTIPGSVPPLRAPLEFDPEMHREQRQRFVKTMGERENVNGSGIAFFEGGHEPAQYDTDMEPLFRQESYYQYLFGVKEADTLSTIDLRSGAWTLFIPRLPETFAIWMGQIHPPQHYAELYGADKVCFVDEFEAVIKEADPPVVYVMHGVNTDSGAKFPLDTLPGSEAFHVDKGTSYDVLRAQRVYKTAKEVVFMRRMNRISSLAHMAVMRATVPGMHEFQMEALFRYFTYSLGAARNLAYTAICASGSRCATLHYGHAAEPNRHRLEDGTTVLNDMGAEYHCYASDITTCFPVNGTFTEQQRHVYDAVLDALWSVMGAMKPGVAWPDMHELAYQRILSTLVTMGVLKGDVQEMIDADIGGFFMPHGLGHLIGLDTHDAGGYPKGYPKRVDRPGFRALRTARKLEAGMAITVEPGLYFNAYSMEKLKEHPRYAEWVNEEALRGYAAAIGGVRLEENVIVTEDGIESLTTVPRTVEEVEAVCAGKITHYAQLTGLRHTQLGADPLDESAKE